MCLTIRFGNTSKRKKQEVSNLPYGTKSKTKTFILTLPLVTDMHDEAVLHNNFMRYSQAYNWLLRKTIKMWHQVRKTKAYKQLLLDIAATPKDSDERKALYIKRTELLSRYGFSGASFEKIIKPFAKYYHLHSAIAQKIAVRVWSTWEKFFYKNGKAVHYKRFDDFGSFAAKSNATGIIFVNDTTPYIKFCGKRIPVSVRKGNTGRYQQEALKHQVKYCAIKRNIVHGRWRYFVQLALADEPPVKCDRYGVIKHSFKNGKIGLDIGTQTLAISGEDICDLRVLAPSAIAELRNGLVKTIARIQRAMDRSRRATNPQYFNVNGTIKRLKRTNGRKQVRKWRYSNHYFRLRYKLRDMHRKLATVRKTEHNILVNELLAHGNIFYVEDMNYKALQKRSKDTKVNIKTGRIHSKKRFGKSLGRCAPAAFLAILEQKAKRYNGQVVRVSTFATKASQFDHTDESYTKKKLSERFAKLSDGTVVQRDIYSAFLLAHLNKNLVTYNNQSIKKDFPQFLTLHEQTKKRLQSSHDWLPASVGF